MFDLGTKWWHHGEKLPRECIPEWQFEGKGIHSSYSRIGSFLHVSGSAGSVNNTGFANIEVAADQAFTDWNGKSSPPKSGMSKVLSFGMIKRIEMFITFNSFTDHLSLDLWKDERKTDLHILEIPPLTKITFLGVAVEQPLVFDHQYAWGFTSLSGVQPDNSEELHYSITSEIYWGSGDPG